MAELKAISPAHGLLPLAIGEAVLSETDPVHLSTLSPFRGKARALSSALKAAHGMGLPRAGRATGKEGARAIWFGRAHTLLAGPAPDPSLSDLAAVTDQSDAWTVLRLEGADAVAVLARLTPLDLRPARFARGDTARTELQHMSVSITRVGERAYLIMGFRSMARTLVHDLETAMEGVASRR